MLRIQRAIIGNRVVFMLSGRIEAQHIPELQALMNAEEQGITLDLKEVNLVDRDTVRFLAWCEAAGVEIDNCLGYIREWIRRGTDGE